MSNPGANLADSRRAFLENAAAALARAQDGQEAVYALVLAAVPALGDWCTVHLFEADGGLRRSALVHRDTLKASVAVRLVGSADVDPNGDHPIGFALATGRAQIINDIEDHHYERNLGPSGIHRKTLFEQLGTKHSIAVPMIHGDKPVGALTVSVGDSGRRYSPSDALVAEELAKSAAAALAGVAGRSPAAERHRQRVRQQAALSALGQLALAGKATDDLMAEAVQLLHETLGAEFVSAFELAGDRLIARFTAGWPGQSEGLEVAASGTTAAAAALGQETPVVVDDYSSDPRAFTDEIISELPNAVSAVHVGIRHGDRITGVLSCHSTRPLAFGPEDVYFLSAVSNVLGAAIARAATEDALRAERERLRLALDAGRMGTWEWDIDANVAWWSNQLEAIFGLEPGTYDGSFDQYMALVHPDDRDGLQAAIQAALESASDYNIEHRIVRPSGEERWVSCSGSTVLDSRGSPTGMVGVTSDITDRLQLWEAERVARAEADQERERTTFLARASDLLAGDLDYRITLTRVAHLLVPRVADWCAIEIVGDDEPVVAHTDPEKVALARDLRRRYPTDPNAPTGLPNVLRTGEPELYTEVPEEALALSAQDEEHLRLLKELQLNSVMIVPLIARGRVLGAMTLIGAESQRRFDEDDLRFAQELARRAAIAIDNAMLYRSSFEAAEALRRSLLPPALPVIPHLAIAAHFDHAGGPSALHIGGDFFDVYQGPAEGWHVVMGDACGKGSSAAAITALTRHTVRAVAMTEHRPAEVLGQLNEALVGQIDASRFCTAVYARVTTEPGRAACTVASGGHPHPLIARASGAVERVDAGGQLIGALPGASYDEVSFELGVGDTLVLYTDGVTEARNGSEQFGEERLMGVLREASGMTPAKMLEVIRAAVAEFSPGEPKDDVAVLALQVTPPHPGQ